MTRSEFDLEIVAHDPPGGRVRTVLTVAWHDAVATAGDPSPTHVRITLGRGAYAGAVLAGVVAFNLAAIGSGWGLAMSGYSSLAMVLYGSWLSCATLLGAWLALSPWAFWKRAIVVGLLTTIGGLMATIPYAILIVAIPTATLFTLRATTGWRFDFRPESPDELPPWRGGGTLIGLFGVVAAWAALVWFGRLMIGEGTSELGEWFTIATFAATTLAVQLTLAAAILSGRSIVAWSIAIGVLAVFGFVALELWRISPTNSTLLALMIAVAGAPAFAANVWLLKRLGWRLYQVNPTAAPEAASSHPLD